MTQAQARRAIVEYCALLWERGLVMGSSGNVSVRLADGTIVVTPAGRSLRNLRGGELVRVSPDGTIVEGGAASSELPLHLAAYRACEAIACVIHTHPTFCVLSSKTGAVFLRDTVGAIESLGRVAWTPYAPAGSQELARLTAEQFTAGVGTVVMERHGLSVAAPDLEGAFVQTELAEEAAKLAIYSRICEFQ